MSNAAPAEHTLLKSRQVSPLPIGSGGNNPVKTQMNQTNTQLTMLQAQAVANTKYDPPVPQPITKQVTKESFSNPLPNMLFVVGGLIVVYGLVAK
jgi:hypothetical protein